MRAAFRRGDVINEGFDSFGITVVITNGYFDLNAIDESVGDFFTDVDRIVQDIFTAIDSQDKRFNASLEIKRVFLVSPFVLKHYK